MFKEVSASNYAGISTERSHHILPTLGTDERTGARVATRAKIVLTAFSRVERWNDEESHRENNTHVHLSLSFIKGKNIAM